jgi:hypothetical protein
MAESELVLPRGCSVEPPNKVLKGLGRIFGVHRQFDDKAEWNHVWAEREADAKKVFQMSTNFTLYGDFEDQSGIDLDKIDDETGLTCWRLLEEGMRDLRDKTLVVATTNRTHLAIEPDSPFATGSAFELLFTRESLVLGKRIARIPFIGIMLNTSVQILPQIDGEMEIPGSYIVDSLNALIKARIAYYREFRAGRLSEYFTQGDFDRALNWALFDK